MVPFITCCTRWFLLLSLWMKCYSVADHVPVMLCIILVQGGSKKNLKFVAIQTKATEQNFPACAIH